MRNQIINSINNLFDENIDLKIRNEYLENTLRKEESCSCCETPKEKQSLSDLELKVFEYGKQKLYEEISPSAYISVRRLDNKKLYITPFDEWVMEAISSYRLPNNFSKEDIANIFNDKLKERYQERKAEAIKNFEKEESKEGEE